MSPIALFNDWIWTAVLIMMIVIGILLTIKFRGAQFKNLKETWNVTFSNRNNDSKTGISSFQAFTLSMGSRVGVGNITGPALAILIGGPGSIFWMWVFSLLGMVTSFVETTIGQIYKSRDENGVCRGGPAYYVSKGLGMKKFGLAIALIMSMMYFIGFISLEVNSMGEAFRIVVDVEHSNLIFAISITLLTILLIVAGLKNIASASTMIVPGMVVCWFVICFLTIALLPGGIVNAFVSIFTYAFTMPSIIGGGIGIIIINGMKRSLLSNEAGVGTIPCISSMAEVSHPVKQGFTQSFSVLLDTIVCTLTALVILSYGSIEEIIHLGGGQSVPTILAVFKAALGGFSSLIVAIFLFIFALTSLMSDVVIGQNNLSLFTKNRNALLLVYAVMLCMIFFTALYADDSLFIIVDILLGVCAIVNVIAMLKLYDRAHEAYHDYREQKARGLDPVFTKDVLKNQTGVTEWDSKE